ncbi:hypothetical protein ACVWXL_002348 [Bradyrhizobium sp. GM22.5]
MPVKRKFLVVDLIIHRDQSFQRRLGQEQNHMPDELLVILGAEATMLVFMAAMTLHAKRMDVLSGWSLERSGVSPTGNTHPPRSIGRKPRDLMRLIRRWDGLTTFDPRNLLRRPTSPERRSRAFKPDAGSAPACDAFSPARHARRRCVRAFRIVQRLEQVGQRGPTSRLDEDLDPHIRQQLGRSVFAERGDLQAYTTADGRGTAAVEAPNLDDENMHADCARSIFSLRARESIRR